MKRSIAFVAMLSVVLLSTCQAGATPAFSLSTEAEWAAAIGPNISPLTVTDWGALDPNFRTNVGTGDFYQSEVFASGGGIYVTPGGDSIDLGPGMGMSWGPDLSGGAPSASNAIGGWRYDWGVDPNIHGSTIFFDATPPLFSPATGFGIVTLGIGLVDANGCTRSWTYNTAAAAGPGNPATLAWNLLNWVSIYVAPKGAGAATDATSGLNPPPGPFPFGVPTFADNGFDPTQAVSIVGIENGFIPAGGTINVPPPGGVNRTVFNWWGAMTVKPIPEPLTMLGVFLGVAGLGGYVRKRLPA